MTGDASIVLSVGTIVSLVGAIVVGTWRLSWVVASFDTKVANIKTAQAERRSEIDDKIMALERDSMELVAQAERRYGETAAAIRQKIVDHELWAERNHVNKDVFSQSVVGLTDRLDAINTRLDVWFDRMEQKLDRQSREHSQRP